jgi:H+/gluconate symporter-like permease
MWLAYRGWSVLRVGPLAALVAAALYGGVSLFVVAFVAAPIADALFREADVPHRLMPAAIALGAFTFT